MTLIVALKGKGHVSMTGDTLEMREQDAAMYCQYRQKIRRVNGSWVIGVSGSLDGLQVVEDLGEKEMPNLSSRLSEAVQQIAEDLLERYKTKNFCGACWFLLIGFHGGRQFIWNWNFVNKGQNAEDVELEGPREQQEKAAIGTFDHGALYFIHEFLTPQMSPGQTALLALHCISEVANHDPRVEGPFTVAVSSSEGTRMYCGDVLDRLLERSKAITASLASQFSDSGLDVSLGS